MVNTSENDLRKIFLGPVVFKLAVEALFFTQVNSRKFATIKVTCVLRDPVNTDCVRLKEYG